MGKFYSRGRLTLSGPTGGAYNMDRICTLEKKLIKVSHGRLVHVSKTLTDLHILGSELHLVAGLWLDPLPSDPLAIIRGGRRKGMKGWE